MKDEKEIREFIGRFERGEWPHERWHHREHVVMAAWYLDRLPLDEALGRIRSGILRHNAVNGIGQTPDSGYHETLTVALARMLAVRLEALRGEPDLPARLAILGPEFADFKARILEHYSRDRIQSWEARTGWVEPNLKPLA